MADGADNIDAMLSELTDAVSTVVYAGETISTAICTGVARTRDRDEQGMLNFASGQVRYKAADEPAAWGGDAVIGKVVTLTIAGGTEQAVRVAGRIAVAGAVRLDVEAELQ